MRRELFQHAMELFEAARKLRGEERRLHLERACAGDLELRAEVEGLLLHHEDCSNDLLEDTRPPGDGDAETFAAVVENDASPTCLTRWQSDKLVCRVAIDLGCITFREAQEFLRRYRQESSMHEVTTALLESKLVTRPELERVMEAFERRLEALSRRRLAAGGRTESAPWLGKTIGEYQVEAVLGRGGMGQVYRARHARLKHEVALKVLSNDAWIGTRISRRFVREAEISAKLKHPHIVSLHDFGTIESGKFYYTMDLVEGESFASLLKRELPHPRRAARFLAKVASAVHYAHTRKVIHRDLKPQNIMVNKAGEPVVLDFGMAKELDAEASVELSQNGMVLGTPCYMSPEQVDGLIGRIDARSDVYALGAILYESLTGRPPFVGESQLDLMLRIKRDSPIPPRQLNPAVSTELEAICLKCLEKARSRRYRTAEELSSDLRALLDNRPIQARPPSVITRATKFVRRHTAVVGAAAVVTLSLVVGLGVSVYQWQRAEQATREAQVAELARDLTLGRIEEEKLRAAGLSRYVDALREEAAAATKLRAKLDQVGVALQSAESEATRATKENESLRAEIAATRETTRQARKVAESTLDLYRQSEELNRHYESRLLSVRESARELVGLIGFLHGIEALVGRFRSLWSDVAEGRAPLVAAGKPGRNVQGRHPPPLDPGALPARTPGAPPDDPESEDRRSAVKIRTDHPDDEEDWLLHARGAAMRRRSPPPPPAIRPQGTTSRGGSSGTATRGVSSGAGRAAWTSRGVRSR